MEPRHGSTSTCHPPDQAVGKRLSADVRTLSWARKNERLVLLALALDGDDATDECRMPLKRVGKVAGLSRQSVITALLNLQLSGEIQLHLDAASQSCIARITLQIGRSVGG
jgi:hypothetical protein